jgi:hypothetical protein
MDTDWTTIYYITMGIYNIPELMGIRFRDEGMFVRNVLAKEETPYVEHPAEEEVYKRIGRGRLLVVRGPKGDGLSVVALAALVRKMLLDRAVVINPIAAGDCLRDVVRLRKVVNAAKEIGREPIFYIDVSKPGHYPQKPWEEDATYMPTSFEKLEKVLEDIRAVFADGEVSTVVVLSDDLYDVLGHKLKRHTAIEVSGGDVRFLMELVQTYSGCGEDVATEVAEAVAKHDCGRATLAVLAADWLAQRNCDREVAAEALKAAEEKVKKFFVDYIWRTVLNGDIQEANLHAPLILLRYFEGPMSVETAEEFLISLGFPWYKVRGSPAARWITSRHCQLVEKAIRELVETALRTRVKDDLYYVIREAAVDYREHFRARGYLK